MTSKPPPVLHRGRIYVTPDRLVCAKMRCAGQTALYTGQTTDAAMLRPIRGSDVIEYASARPGRPVTCECGALAGRFSMRDGLTVERVTPNVSGVAPTLDDTTPEERNPDMTATTTERPADQCPSWCLSDHAHDRHLDAREQLHKAAPLGMFEVWMMNGVITATLREGIDNSVDMSAADLRQLSRDAIVAAEWIEANR